MLEEACALAQRVAREAGELIRRGRSHGFELHSKGGVDLVTEVDAAAEELIISALSARFPSHRMVGEETAVLGGEEGIPAAPTWYVDPLDGTTNYVCGQTDVVVSIAFACGGRLLLGVVFNPFTDELFHAVAGRGAFCNGRPIRVGGGGFAEAVVVTNVGPSRDAAFISGAVGRMERVLRARVRGLRAGGSCAMNMCYVASGRMGAFYEVGFGGPWDVAAGAVIVAEAGGVVRAAAPGGAPFVLRHGRGDVLCGNKEVVEALALVIEGPPPRSGVLPVLLGLAAAALTLLAAR